MTEIEKKDSITGHVLTVDIVDFSLRKSSDEQRQLIQDFIVLLKAAIPPQHNNERERIWSPAGDGGSLTFINSFRAPIATVVELFALLEKYNSGTLTGGALNLKKPVQPLQIRVGIHTGPVSLQEDFDRRVNVWGNGINLSARLITLARPNQILVSAEHYREAELHARPQGIDVQPIGKRWVKHNKFMSVYNAYKEGIGIPFDESDVWFSALQAPLLHAMRAYQGMLADEHASGSPFRVAILAKRLIDLDTARNPTVLLGAERQGAQRLSATDIIRSISSQKHGSGIGRRNLYDPFLSPFSSDALVYFFQNASFTSYAENEFLAREDDLAKELMIIVSGVVGVYRGEEKVRVVDKESRHVIEVEFGEGYIVGEMGLFSPNQRRNATLKAEQSTVVLKVPYESLAISLEYRNAVDYPLRVEIRRHIWTYYCNRTKENHLSYHKLLRMLNEEAISSLLAAAQFLPSEFEGELLMEPDDLWDKWTFIIAGTATVNTRENAKSIEFKAGDCIGPLRLVMQHNPYIEVSWTPDIQIVQIPWTAIEAILSGNLEFDDASTKLGRQERRRLGLL